MYLKFIKFLKRHEAFTEFKKSCKKYHGPSKKTVKDICDERWPKYYLFLAFPWAKSNKGYSFWSNLNEKWKKLL